MDHKHGSHYSSLVALVGVPLLLVLLLVGAYLGHAEDKAQETRRVALEAKLDAQVELLASTTASLSRALALIDESLTSTREESSAAARSLADRLAAEQAKAASLQDQVKNIGSTVGTLDKLSRIDPELLQKYSKVFFLNEHYAPPTLATILPQYLYNENAPMQLHAQVLPSLVEMITSAKSAGVTLYVKSAFRSFSQQAELKGQYSVTYGAGSANSFSADQGYSEHQLGTTVDMITTGLGGSLDGFDNTKAYTWMVANAYKYGFVLSYPESNKYYVYEPWHWRYVGIGLATRLHQEGKYFYDYDQRVIDTYLVSIFD